MIDVPAHFPPIQSLLVGPIVVAWLIANRMPSRGVPPVAAALVAGIGVALFLAPHGGGQLTLSLTSPVFYTPHFTLDAFLSLSVPLLFLVTSQNASGIGVLWTRGYRPPITAITLCTGAFTLLTAMMGGQGVSVGAQRSAVAGDPSVHDNPDRRYGALVVDALMVLTSAGMATTVVSLFALLPPSVIRVVAGLAILPVALQALERAVSNGQYRFGGFFALVIAASNVSLFGVSSVFWSLVLAPLLMLTMDRRHKSIG